MASKLDGHNIFDVMKSIARPAVPDADLAAWVDSRDPVNAAKLRRTPREDRVAAYHSQIVFLGVMFFAAPFGPPVVPPRSPL